MTQGAPRGEPGAATRALAARAVAGVLDAGRTLDDALAGLDLGPLAAADRAQVRALAYGALRGYHRHRALLALLLDRPLPARERLVEALLSVGLFQLLDGGQPEYAAVSATVEAARALGRPRAAGLVNATLRRLQREREALLARVAAGDEGRWSHPAWLVARLRADWPEDWRELLEAAQRPPPLWLRVNLARTTRAAFCARLGAAGVDHATGDLPEAVRLVAPRPVAEIPGFAAGEASVQDQASQLAARLLAPSPGQRVLDACAAPGGKATHLLELAGGRLELTALDVDAARLGRVRENLARLGLAAELRVADATRTAEWWDGRPFDRVLVDAPCSGTGVIRRHPDIKCLRREADVVTFAARQLALLGALWPLVAPGGRLLYATCSVLREENAAVAARFLAAHPDAVAAAPSGALPPWAPARGGPGWQALPGAADTDGLYYALMARRPA
jgi:16S rRNA (cytosine967-C5)-methyltransferase